MIKDKKVLERCLASEDVFGIIGLLNVEEDTNMYTICKIDRGIYKCITEDITTDEVIITDNQIRHILDRHPDAYEAVMVYMKDVLESPDFIIEDKHKNTGLVIRQIKKENRYVQIVLRICTSKDVSGYRNSVISCWEISIRRLQNYLRNVKF